MRNHFLETVIGTAVVFLVAAGVVWLGWNEPLSYRFMSQQEIAEREMALNPIATPRALPGTADWNPQGTSLDRAPYSRTRTGTVRYNQKEFDSREMGISSETGKRANTTNSPDR